MADLMHAGRSERTGRRSRADAHSRAGRRARQSPKRAGQQTVLLRSPLPRGSIMLELFMSEGLAPQPAGHDHSSPAVCCGRTDRIGYAYHGPGAARAAVPRWRVESLPAADIARQLTSSPARPASPAPCSTPPRPQTGHRNIATTVLVPMGDRRSPCRHRARAAKYPGQKRFWTLQQTVALA